MKPLQAMKRSILLGPIAAATATRSAMLDTLGADYATIDVAVGVRADSTVASSVTIAITEGDVATGSFVTFDSSMSRAIAIGTSPKVASFQIGMNGERKRFLKVVSTPGTVASADAVIITAIGVVDPEIRPSGTTGVADVVVIA